MKMVMTLNVEQSGCIYFLKRSGAVLQSGCIMAHMELDDPSSVLRVKKKKKKKSILEHLHLIILYQWDILCFPL